MMRRGGRALGPALAAIWLTAVPALAGLQICNDTADPQSVAIGFKGDSDWTSQGWWNIASGDCALVIGGDLRLRYYYYYAESPGGTFKSQDYLFCARDDVFEIVGDLDCEDRGFYTLSMREIDTGETARDFTLTLVDEGGPGGGNTPRLGSELEDEGPDPDVTAGPAGPGGGLGATPDAVVQNITITPPDQMPLTVSMEDLVTDLPEGQYGEPFETAALFQGCELEGGREYCSFHAGNLKKRVFYRGPTPERLMYALEDLAINMPVKLEGDLVETNGAVAAIVVRSVVPTPGEDKDAHLRAALQGDWLDQGDRRWEMTVLGSEIYFRHNGRYSTHRFFRLADTCEAADGPGPVMMQVNTETGRQTCFRIDRADGGALELTDVERGRTNTYRRLR